MNEVFYSGLTTLKTVKINAEFWKYFKQMNEDVILPAIYDVYEKTGRIASFQHNRREDQWFEPHIFWDSDVAKWMETAAYILSEGENKDLEKKLEDLIDLIEKNQDESGYFNSYFQTMEPDNKWKRIGDHELYCIGHLIEAAVAYYKATGKDRFLKLMEKSVDHIIDVFTIKQTSEFKYPGHQEIELALIRLYEVTGYEKYFKLAEHFLSQRGQKYKDRFNVDYSQTVIQQHQPVDKQYEAVGHAVRAAYMYSAMADIALIGRNENLWNTVMKLWSDITDKKMFVTGGVGTSHSGEAYTYPYDLPNEYGYTETCASIGLVFMAARLMCAGLPDSRYADVLERALYNTVLGCVSSDGTQFFYSNPVAVDPKLDNYIKLLKKNNMAGRERIIPSTSRRKDLGCNCCPGNVSRLIASINNYIVSESDEKIMIHMPLACEFKTDEGLVTIESDYPTGSTFKITFKMQKLSDKMVYFRIPGWCSLKSVSLNDKPYDYKMTNGYMMFSGLTQGETVVLINSDMNVLKVRAHPAIKDAAGKIAIQKGPFVYCLEEADNGDMLYNAYIDAETGFEMKTDVDISKQVPVLTCLGKMIRCNQESLYFTDNFTYEDRKLKFIPFFTRLNRRTGEMIVWVNEYKR